MPYVYDPDTATMVYREEEVRYLVADSNQIPNPISTVTTVNPIFGIVSDACANLPSLNDSGPSAGGMGAFPTFIGDVIEFPDGEQLYRPLGPHPGYQNIGFATEFVNFPHIAHGGNIKVIKEVAGYLQAMIGGAAEDGITLGIRSGFRNMGDQQYYYSFSSSNPAARAALAAGNLVDLRGRTRTAIGNAAAGAGRSNHQNGIAFDFNVTGQSGRVYEWMVRNAWKYGFIRAVSNERWHWEYWGDWVGQDKPEWAKHSGWGPNGHQPKTMFGIVPRTRVTKIRVKHYWNRGYGAPSPHTDEQSGGDTNTWIGFGNEHLPDKFDRLYPGWNIA